MPFESDKVKYKICSKYLRFRMNDPRDRAIVEVIDKMVVEERLTWSSAGIKLVEEALINRGLIEKGSPEKGRDV